MPTTFVVPKWPSKQVLSGPRALFLFRVDMDARAQHGMAVDNYIWCFLSIFDDLMQKDPLTVDTFFVIRGLSFGRD